MLICTFSGQYMPVVNRYSFTLYTAAAALYSFYPSSFHCFIQGNRFCHILVGFQTCTRHLFAFSACPPWLADAVIVPPRKGTVVPEWKCKKTRRGGWTAPPQWLHRHRKYIDYGSYRPRNLEFWRCVKREANLCLRFHHASVVAVSVRGYQVRSVRLSVHAWYHTY